MTDKEKIVFKNNLKQLGESIIIKRIDAAGVAILGAQQAANNEEKSSAGDKYETSRAMSHLEKDMYSRQLSENIKELEGLRAIKVNAIYEAVMPGAYIHCSGVSFFIAAGLGKQVIENATIFFLSPQAPLAKLLFNKRTGDQFDFNKVATKIIEVF